MTVTPDSLGLKLSKPRIVMTARGEREVCDAPVTEQFWTAWRAGKEALKAAGYSVSKDNNGVWKVALWRETMPQEVRQAAAQASRSAEVATIDIPIPAGRALLPYQSAGIAYALARPATLIADEMGLGKSIQAIAVANVMQAQRILVICPASLLTNWKNEIGRWQTLALPVQVIRAGRTIAAGASWVIINYDIAGRYPDLKASEWDLVIIDEAQYLKNSKAKRTQFILGSYKAKIAAIPAKRKLILTGTPILNKPAEIHTLLSYIDRARWGGYGAFAKRYNGAFMGKYGFELGNPQNLDELQRRLRETCMVRRLKADVLTELPAKRRQIVLVDLNGEGAALIASEKAAEAKTEAALAEATYAMQRAEAEGSEEDYKAAVAALNAARGIAFTEMARVRHETAVAKVPAVIEHLEGTSGKVVVFAWHRDVIDAIVKAVKDEGVVSITGDTPNEQRQDLVDRFQTDANVRFFVGNMRAAGVGLTLTAASHVVFAELDWVPANVTQAEDRCHRIGQRESVLVQHLVLDGSIDARMAETVVEKQDMADKALDRHYEEPVYAAYEPKAEAKVEPKPEPIALTEAQTVALKRALRAVAGMDADGARVRNDVGFNKMDTRFGQELAARERLSPRQAAAGMKLIRKYRRQYSADLYAAMFGGTP